MGAAGCSCSPSTPSSSATRGGRSSRTRAGATTSPARASHAITRSAGRTSSAWLGVGVKPEHVDVVVCTHLHIDHVGWNTRLVDGRWVPTFPRARYLFARREWEFWREEYKTERFTGDPYHEDSIVPILDAGLADLVEPDQRIDDG